MESGLIYCVDDDEEILVLYKKVLNHAGYKVTCLASGAAALQAISQQEPDIILLDEIMNDYSGMEVCSRLRSDPKISYIPIIMVTGLDSREGKIRSLEKGIDDYILKPFDPEELLAKVMVMLRIKRLYNDLLRTRQDLIKAERLAAVGQWAAAMAHEIRNPLSIINASVQLMKNQMQQQPELVKEMETIIRKISEIDGTIRELLAAAQPLKFKHEPVQLNNCLQELVSFIKDKCQAQQVRLMLELDPALPKVLGDAEYLQRAFLNMFINSLNSMPQGGLLQVNTRTSAENRVEIQVVDTGRGILPEDIEHLFEPFFTRRTGGSGLGLYVVKMVFDELQGKITVDSIPDKGTTFTLSLPGISLQ